MLGLRHTLRARPSFLDFISKKPTHHRSRSDSTVDSLEEEDEQSTSLPTAPLSAPQGSPSPPPTIETPEACKMAAVSCKLHSLPLIDQQADRRLPSI